MSSQRFTLALLLLGACAPDTSLFTGDPTPTGTGGAGGTGTGGSTPGTTSRVDLLVSIDNSRSMADKQEILGLAVPTLIDSFVNPRCLDADGVPAPDQPAGAAEPCPTGTTRQMAPVSDMHIGVISTSLGGHGADACQGGIDPSENDAAHLLSRDGGGGVVETYAALGFLAWDPKQAAQPPGESSPDALVNDLTTMILGVGQLGCGYEAQLESWYRFLVDPDPYESIEIDQNASAVFVGTDDSVLAQRRDFLRPDSALVVLMLSDENDCSIRDGGQYYFAAQLSIGGTGFHLPRARHACAIDPEDPCCRSCGQPPGAGCDTTLDACGTPLDPIEDHPNLRCWDQKRRFGIDFLQPIDRYLTGLGSPNVPDRDGNLVANPIYSDLDPSDDISGVRTPSKVFLASISGVPWQDIARRTTGGTPDLENGRDAAGNPIGGFKSAAELVSSGGWAIVLGDPIHYHTNPAALPDDPLMIESVAPRSGANPVTGDLLAPPGAPKHANPINGHEYTSGSGGDLQYACVFDLGTPRNCADPNQVACDCGSAANDNPLCQDETNAFGTVQYRAKAYPGIRQLSVLKGFGGQAVVGSICPAQIDDPTALDYGYVPTVRSLLEAVAPHLVKE